jgi:hypothetical protein
MSISTKNKERIIRGYLMMWISTPLSPVYLICFLIIE